MVLFQRSYSTGLEKESLVVAFPLSFRVALDFFIGQSILQLPTSPSQPSTSSPPSSLNNITHTTPGGYQKEISEDCSTVFNLPSLAFSLLLCVTLFSNNTKGKGTVIPPATGNESHYTWCFVSCRWMCVLNICFMKSYSWRSESYPKGCVKIL